MATKATKGTGKGRDDAQTAAQFRKLATEQGKLFKSSVKDELHDFAVKKAMSAGIALYSAGDPVKESRAWFDRAVSERIAHMEERSYALPGYAIGSDLEVFPAASLVGRAEELVAAFRRCTFGQFLAGDLGLIEGLCAALLGEEVKERSGAAAELKKRAKDWLPLLAVFKAVSKQDRKAFESALTEFLKSSWKKDIRAAQKRLETYTGRWCLLGAALCEKLGYIPDLPKEVGDFIPVELISLDR